MTNEEEKNAYLASVAHDLKNPLGAIFSYTDLLLSEHIKADLSPRASEIVERIRLTVGRALELVRNYQDLAELDRVKAHDGNSKVEINEVVRQVCETTWFDKKNSAPLTLLLDPHSLIVSAQRVQIDRIFSNLLQNALKYTPKTGKILVETKQDGKFCLLRVSNFGVSIPDAELPKLFAKHQRGSTSKGTQGSGLGLFIVKEIVKGLGGKIEMKSSGEENFTVCEVGLECCV